MHRSTEEIHERTQKGVAHERAAQKIQWRDWFKEISLAGESVPFRVPRSACVSKGDMVTHDQRGALVRCGNGLARILPNYAACEDLRAGNLTLEIVIKEITDAEEFGAYQGLSEFHYREQTLHGRTARLVARNFHPNYPKVVGYIELTTPFYMNKPRAAILDAPFAADGIEWERWDMETTRRYINLIVRVGRCVVYPEFRGLGLGQVLLKHAAAFAVERWQVASMKPYFLEISADMLKYVPFAARAGMTFIGETQGNLGRVAKDMNYLLKNRLRVKAGTIVKEDACGIVDQQVARMDRAAALMERQGWSLDELNTKLKRLSSVAVLRDFDLFREIVSLPKPTYLQGLTPEAENYLQKRAAAVAPKNGHVPAPICLQPIATQVVVEDVRLEFQSRVRRTQQTHAIQQAFAISPGEFRHTVVRNLSLTIDPGNVVLITGSSGAGKTTLLQLFSGVKSGMPKEGHLDLPANYHAGAFAPIQSQKALIEILGGGDVNAALHLMGMVGLSDAFVYLKRFAELSNGQQYRAMLAQLITSGNNVWLADEFCANLDPLTANVVADRLQRLARRLRAVLIVASSQPETFAHALKPDQVVQLTTAWEHRVMPGVEFLRAIPNAHPRFAAPSLSVALEYLPAIRSGRKCTTVRKGRLVLEKGLLLLTSREGFEPVNVIEVRETRVENLVNGDAVNDGFENVVDLRRALLKHYPTLRETSVLTIVTFERLCLAKSALAAARRTNGLGVD